MARSQRSAQRESPADNPRLSLDDALALVSGRPIARAPFSPGEDAALRKLYPAYAARGCIPDLVAIWPRVAGTERSMASLSMRAVRIGCTCRRVRR